MLWWDPHAVCGLGWGGTGVISGTEMLLGRWDLLSQERGIQRGGPSSATSALGPLG